MKRTWIQAAIGVALVGALIAYRSYSLHHGGGVLLSIDRPLMGTLWKVAVLDHGDPDGARQAINAAYSELERIDRLMSEWKPESPISQVNAAAGKGPVEVPAELRELLERSIAYTKRTSGTFDITWRGMGRIWRFDDEFRVPDEATVAEARKRIDASKIRIEGNRISLPANMNIGLGGVAKGYAIDRAAAVLRARGFTDFLVDGGGDVLVGGSREGGEPWTLGVQDPRSEHGSIIGVVRMKQGGSLVTSGDYERYREVNGVRYHHIIDPRTGWPGREAMSVSILSPTAEAGVVLAKGVFLLGAEQGLALAKREGVEAMLIDPSKKVHMTPGFDKAYERRSAAIFTER